MESAYQKWEKRRRERSGGRRTAERRRGTAVALGPRERRRLAQLAVCLVLFLAVFVGKGVFPHRLAAVRGAVLEVLRTDTDFRSAFAELGRSASQGEPLLDTLGELWVEVFGGTALAEPDEAAIARVLDAEGAVCVGVPGEDGRLHAPGIPMSRLTALADYIIVEADGSKRLPLKAHAAHEPVIPVEAGRTICVVGMSGLGRRVSEAVHRPELFAPCDVPVTEELLASVLNREALADVYFLNQCDICGMERARKLAALLDRPSVCGSIREGTAVCLW